MKKLHKLLFELNMTWKNTIIYAIVCGVITGIIPLLKFLDDTSIHNVAVCFEMWILLAMIIILNCKKPLEAALKTFVFFLISQPLCYLVQVPFYYDGFGIFIYYPHWAFYTVLTFPGAIVAYYVKKQNYLSVLIMTIILFALDSELCWHFCEMLKNFPFQILAVLFIILEIVLFILLIFKDKKKRIILFIISLILLIPGYITYRNSTDLVEVKDKTSILQLEEDVYEVVSKDDNVEVKIIDEFVYVTASINGEYNIILRNSKNEEVKLLYIVTDTENDLNIIK